jgi:proteasome lid subunit RPN8/RPN11
MNKIKISKNLVESIQEAAKSAFPNEFLALVGVNDKGVLSELVVLPAVYGKTFSLLQTHLIPVDSKIVGSVHSHPSSNNFPSKGDLRTFPALGVVHLIISKPFTLKELKCFDSKGNKKEFEVVKEKDLK